MEQQLAFSTGKTGLEDELLWNEAASAAYFGRLNQGRTLYLQAIASAQGTEEKEAAAGYGSGRGTEGSSLRGAAESRVCPPPFDRTRRAVRGGAGARIGRRYISGILVGKGFREAFSGGYDPLLH